MWSTRVIIIQKGASNYNFFKHTIGALKWYVIKAKGPLNCEHFRYVGPLNLCIFLIVECNPSWIQIVRD